MFYPTCYVYKIALNNDTTPSNETTPPNKKSEVSSTKKPKTPTATAAAPPPAPTSINTRLDTLSNNNKTESTLIKNLANQLLISAQRTNCVDIEKK